jgi:excinuclease ABC subunit A
VAEPTTGHAADVDKLMTQLNTFIDPGNTVVVVEHDIRVVAASDWVIEMWTGAADLRRAHCCKEDPPRKSLKIRRAERRPVWAPQVLDKLLIQLHCCTARGLAEPGA